ncbi:hypothetical protein AAEU32_05755 [Pseudoalteromonas sp. SSDWG2]|uniref:hypothetical protein n=1 Tax=Pseudoalteromonas sp. SSDWG2 TaxID=3139391 RepID=UPI003BA967B9
MKFVVMVIILIVISGCGGNADGLNTRHDARSVILAYQQQVDELLTASKLGIHSSLSAQQLDQLYNLGQVLVGQVLEERNLCDSYLSTIAKSAPMLREASTSQLQTGYLEEQALPDFDAPICFHIKELVFHPLHIHSNLQTNPALAQKELNEVRAHAAVVYEYLQRAI